MAFVPVTASAQSDDPEGLLTCENKCGWDDLVELAQVIIRFILGISIPIAAAMFAYAGFTYLTAAGDPGKIKKAHGIFQNVFWGFVLILSAWLIINLLTTFFLKGSPSAEDIFKNVPTE